MIQKQNNLKRQLYTTAQQKVKDEFKKEVLHNKQNVLNGISLASYSYDVITEHYKGAVQIA